MKKTLVLALCLILTGAFAFASNLKTGFVNSQAVLESFNKYREAYSDLEKIREPLLASLQQKEKELMDMQQKLESNVLMSEANKRKEMARIQEKYSDLQDELQRSQTQLANEEHKRVAPLLSEVREAIKKVARAKGFNVIKDAGDPALIWLEDDLDITDSVIQELNK